MQTRRHQVEAAGGKIGGAGRENCQMRILVIEDDKKIASFIVKGLKQSGFAVDHAANGEDGLVLATSTPYDAAVIDIMLPKLDGLGLVQELRNRRINLPVLILSARASGDDPIKGLQSGADDFLVKPFAFSALLARVQALIRRASRETEPTTLTVGDLTQIGRASCRERV